MLRFKAEQKNFRIGDVEIGGQPGELPTVMIGSIFYSGDPLVSDAKRGLFDKTRAKSLLEKEGELSRELALPRIIDVIAETSEAMKRYIDFILENTESPFLVDSTSRSVRIEATKYLHSIDQVDRGIYNSIDIHHSEEELNSIAESGVKSAVLLAFSTKHLMPQDRIKVLKRGEGETGLIDVAEQAGIENPLIDLGVLDLPSVSWTSQAIEIVKDELGYPCGCAPVNALYSWKKEKRIEESAFKSSAAAIINLPIIYGADFVFYGPIANAQWVYPACAAVNAMIAYGGRTVKISPKTKQHPLYRIL